MIRRGGFREGSRESGGKLPAVRKLSQWVVVGEVVQLPGSLGYVTFQLSLVRAQLTLSFGNLVRHRVERLGHLVELGEASSRCPRLAIAPGQLAGRDDQTPDREADTERQ